MDLKNMKARKVLVAPRLDVPEQLLISCAQVGVFTDPNVAKLTAMKTVWLKSSAFPPALNPHPRHSSLWNPKPTSHSRYMTKVCAIFDERMICILTSSVPSLQSFLSQLKLVGGMPSLGHAPAILAISSREEGACRVLESFPDVLAASVEAR